MKTHIVYIGIVLFLFGIIYIGKKSNQVRVYKEKYTVINEKIDTQYIKKRYNVYKNGKDIFHDTTIYVKVPYLNQDNIDSIEQEFYAKNIYKDTIKLDSMRIYITDTIRMNNILSRSVSSDFMYPLIIKEKYLSNKPKTEFYIGPKVDIFQNKKINSFGVGFIIKSTKNKMMQLYVDRGINGRFAYGTGLYIKL